jgi:hypothetical protein
VLGELLIKLPAVDIFSLPLFSFSNILGFSASTGFLKFHISSSFEDYLGDVNMGNEKTIVVIG